MVSIIIPVYNREQYIEECIRSIQAQTYKNYEIILIDDGSTDNTLPLCRSLAASDPAIRIFECGHAGVSAARNMGLDAVQGDYVFFIDSDDVIYPTLLETLVNGLKEHNAEMACTGKVGVDENNWYKVRKKLSEVPQKGDIDYLTNEETVNELLVTGQSPFNGVGGVMLRRNLIQNTRFNTDLSIGEDFCFNYENVIKGASSITLKQKWYYCRHHLDNVTSNVAFSGFYSRFYRRVLVWRSEDKLGRVHFSTIQKLDAVGCFMQHLQIYKPFSSDAKKTRNTFKKYRKELYPVLSFKMKVLCFLHAYFPFLSPLIFLAMRLIIKMHPH